MGSPLTGSRPAGGFAEWRGQGTVQRDRGMAAHASVASVC